MEEKKLKTLGEILTKGGPSYFKTREALMNWLEEYRNRNQEGDINLIKFLEHFIEDEKQRSRTTTY